jgi:tRNA threonylcarbamoyladenosine biosynthesis protein TsaB
MNVLALETSTQPGSLALLAGDRVVWDETFSPATRTSQSFAPAMDAALKAFARPAAELDVFAVCDGPGSFTGLRIGVTAAKSFAYATGVAVVAIDSLQVIASQTEQPHQPTWSVIYAQREQVFASLFVDGRPAVQTCIMDEHEWLSRLEPGQTVTGPGLTRCRNLLPPFVTVADELLWLPRAVTLARLAGDAYKAGHRADIWSLVPRYFRKSAAEELRTKAR